MYNTIDKRTEGEMTMLVKKIMIILISNFFNRFQFFYSSIFCNIS